MKVAFPSIHTSEFREDVDLKQQQQQKKAACQHDGRADIGHAGLFQRPGSSNQIQQSIMHRLRDWRRGKPGMQTSASLTQTQRENEGSESIRHLCLALPAAAEVGWMCDVSIAHSFMRAGLVAFPFFYSPFPSHSSSLSHTHTYTYIYVIYTFPSACGRIPFGIVAKAARLSSARRNQAVAYFLISPTSHHSLELARFDSNQLCRIRLRAVSLSLPFFPFPLSLWLLRLLETLL